MPDNPDRKRSDYPSKYWYEAITSALRLSPTLWDTWKHLSQDGKERMLLAIEHAIEDQHAALAAEVKTNTKGDDMASFDQFCTVTIYEVYGKRLDEIKIPDGYEVIGFRLKREGEPFIRAIGFGVGSTIGPLEMAGWGPRLILRKKPAHVGWWFQFLREDTDIGKGEWYVDTYGGMSLNGCGSTLFLEKARRIYRRTERTE